MIRKNKQSLKGIICNSLLLLTLTEGNASETSLEVNDYKVKSQLWPPEIIDDYDPTQPIKQLNNNEEESFGFKLISKESCLDLSQSDLNLENITDKNKKRVALTHMISPFSRVTLNEELYLVRINSSTCLFANDPDIFDLDSSVVIVSIGIVNAYGEVSHSSDEDCTFQKLIVFQDKAAADQEVYNTSWRKFAKDAACSGVKYVGGKVQDNTNYYGRLIGAWHINHLAVDTLEELTANIVWGVANVSGGPAAGTGAYYTVKSVLKTLRFVMPGFEEYLSGIYAPITKTFVVDPLINYGPLVIKSLAKVNVVNVKNTYSTVEFLYRWIRG